MQAALQGMEEAESITWYILHDHAKVLVKLHS